MFFIQSSHQVETSLSRTQIWDGGSNQIQISGQPKAFFLQELLIILMASGVVKWDCQRVRQREF
ncbi:MAG: hypothetical protein CL677_09840 [Bdellovibrionaceae bacterium]|nr:hypothetical protein [Pseudobdellovibrionaceae bacterium]